MEADKPEMPQTALHTQAPKPIQRESERCIVHPVPDKVGGHLNGQPWRKWSLGVCRMMQVSGLECVREIGYELLWDEEPSTPQLLLLACCCNCVWPVVHGSSMSHHEWHVSTPSHFGFNILCSTAVGFSLTWPSR